MISDDGFNNVYDIYLDDDTFNIMDDDLFNLNQLQRLITAGADVNTNNSRGWTCLISSAIEGEYKATKLLIENE